ncbi:MAG: hypothetical protein LBG64_00020 [Pseudomonadales bacterium]|jgi:hypothetical protein|nr:hypothetical protein [Pseudomonadales bacterium]
MPERSYIPEGAENWQRSPEAESVDIAPSEDLEIVESTPPSPSEENTLEETRSTYQSLMQDLRDIFMGDTPREDSATAEGTLTARYGKELVDQANSDPEVYQFVIDGLINYWQQHKSDADVLKVAEVIKDAYVDGLEYHNDFSQQQKKQLLELAVDVMHSSIAIDSAGAYESLANDLLELNILEGIDVKSDFFDQNKQLILDNIDSLEQISHIPRDEVPDEKMEKMLTELVKIETSLKSILGKIQPLVEKKYFNAVDAQALSHALVEFYSIDGDSHYNSNFYDNKFLLVEPIKQLHDLGLLSDLMKDKLRPFFANKARQLNSFDREGIKLLLEYGLLDKEALQSQARNVVENYLNNDSLTHLFLNVDIGFVDFGDSEIRGRVKDAATSYLQEGKFGVGIVDLIDAGVLEADETKNILIKNIIASLQSNDSQYNSYFIFAEIFKRLPELSTNVAYHQALMDRIDRSLINHGNIGELKEVIRLNLIDLDDQRDEDRVKSMIVSYLRMREPDNNFIDLVNGHIIDINEFSDEVHQSLLRLLRSSQINYDIVETVLHYLPDLGADRDYQQAMMDRIEKDLVGNSNGGYKIIKMSQQKLLDFENAEVRNKLRNAVATYLDVKGLDQSIIDLVNNNLIEASDINEFASEKILSLTQQSEKTGYQFDDRVVFSNILSFSKKGEEIKSLLKSAVVKHVERSSEANFEDLEKVDEAIETIGNFLDKYQTSNKARTVLGLVVFNNYYADANIADNLKLIAAELSRREKVIDQLSANNIPEGARVSIGLEYEITQSTANGYAASKENRSLREDLIKLAEAVGVGRGSDAVFEIATKPTDNPYLMLWEMQELQEAGFMDFNFNREGYENGSHGMHLTIGGEAGIGADNKLTKFFANLIQISQWGGVNAGKEVDGFGGSRDLPLRSRSSYSVDPMFVKNGQATEFRTIAIDAEEPFERSVIALYYAGIAMQIWEKNQDKVSLFGKNLASDALIGEFEELVQAGERVNIDVNDRNEKRIMSALMELMHGVQADIAWHNENFMESETNGYLDQNGGWVETGDFGGEYNSVRFYGVIDAVGETQESYMEKIKVSATDMFTKVDHKLTNQITNITNLFVKAAGEGDMANATAILETTKFNNNHLEDSRSNARFDSVLSGKKRREGYYLLQGGSEKMLIHSVQSRLLTFVETMEKIVR